MNKLSTMSIVGGTGFGSMPPVRMVLARQSAPATKSKPADARALAAQCARDFARALDSQSVGMLPLDALRQLQRLPDARRMEFFGELLAQLRTRGYIR